MPVMATYGKQNTFVKTRAGVGREFSDLYVAVDLG